MSYHLFSVRFRHYGMSDLRMSRVKPSGYHLELHLSSQFHIVFLTQAKLSNYAKRSSLGSLPCYTSCSLDLSFFFVVAEAADDAFTAICRE